MSLLEWTPRRCSSGPPRDRRSLSPVLLLENFLRSFETSTRHSALHRTPGTLRTPRTPRTLPAHRAHCARCAHRAHCPHAAHTAHAAHAAHTACTPRTLRALRTPRTLPAHHAHCARRVRRTHCPHTAHTKHASAPPALHVRRDQVGSDANTKAEWTAYLESKADSAKWPKGLRTYDDKLYYN